MTQHKGEYMYPLKIMYLDEMLHRWGKSIPHTDEIDFLDKLRGITYVDSRPKGGYYVEMNDECKEL